jgi:hypothetical protein
MRKISIVISFLTFCISCSMLVEASTEVETSPAVKPRSIGDIMRERLMNPPPMSEKEMEEHMKNATRITNEELGLVPAPWDSDMDD